MKITAGDSLLDGLLDGGYEKDIINTLYGPAGSGKTLLCMLAAKEVSRQGKKIIFVDTEGGFSAERLKQISDDHEKVLSNIFFLKPTNFKEQKDAFEKLRDLVNDKIGLIVVDTISMLYRLELGKNDDVYDVNKALGQQLAYLNEIARKKNIPILITNQVYANFASQGQVKIVGGDLLKYGSKCMIELQAANAGHRKAIVKKHRSIPSGKSSLFRISQKGLDRIK